MQHNKYWKRSEDGKPYHRREKIVEVTPLYPEEWLARGWKPAPEEPERMKFRSTIGSCKDYAEMLEAMANETVWLPAKINRNGTIENVTQAYVTVRGADPGESNFRKMQKPTKHGYKEGCDLGTYVMNLHTEIEILRPGANEIDPEARVLRYGKRVKRRYLSPQDRIFAEAAEQAAMILREKPNLFSNNSTAQSTSTEAERIQN